MKKFYVGAHRLLYHAGCVCLLDELKSILLRLVTVAEMECWDEAVERDMIERSAKDQDVTSEVRGSSDRTLNSIGRAKWDTARPVVSQEQTHGSVEPGTDQALEESMAKLRLSSPQQQDKRQGTQSSGPANGRKPKSNTRDLGAELKAVTLELNTARRRTAELEAALELVLTYVKLHAPEHLDAKFLHIACWKIQSRPLIDTDARR